ncbi:hypothetical protein [Pseudonocardia kujensis]|nr:hypothetical protein [Pseudonocardia kujensis]
MMKSPSVALGAIGAVVSDGFRLASPALLDHSLAPHPQAPTNR